MFRVVKFCNFVLLSESAKCALEFSRGERNPQIIITRVSKQRPLGVTVLVPGADVVQVEAAFHRSVLEGVEVDQRLRGPGGDILLAVEAEIEVLHHVHAKHQRQTDRAGRRYVDYRVVLNGDI